jgi:hypothetical protein
MFESLLNLCGQLPPEVAFNILDLVIDLSELPGKDEIVRRVRKLNGQIDPTKMDSPEGQEELAAMQQQEQEQAAIQHQAVVNQLAEQEANIRKLLADVQLVMEKARTEQVNREVAATRVVIDRERMEADTELKFREHAEDSGSTSRKINQKGGK